MPGACWAVPPSSAESRSSVAAPSLKNMDLEQPSPREPQKPLLPQAHPEILLLGYGVSWGVCSSVPGYRKLDSQENVAVAISFPTCPGMRATGKHEHDPVLQQHGLSIGRTRGAFFFLIDK